MNMGVSPGKYWGGSNFSTWVGVGPKVAVFLMTVTLWIACCVTFFNRGLIFLLLSYEYSWNMTY